MQMWTINNNCKEKSNSLAKQFDDLNTNLVELRLPIKEQ